MEEMDLAGQVEGQWLPAWRSRAWRHSQNKCGYDDELKGRQAPRSVAVVT